MTNSPADLLNQLRIDRGAPPPRRGVWGVAGVLFGLAALAGMGWMWWQGRADAALPVRTAIAVAMDAHVAAAASVLDATGYVVARRMATVSAKVTGKVEDVLIEEGMQVQAGQIMARLEPIDAEAELALAQARVDAARSQVGSVQAQWREAQAQAARQQALIDRQLISRAHYDQAIAARDALRAQLDAARHQVKVARDGLRIAELGLENTIVRAPFAGVVIAKAAQPGEIVSPLSAGGGFTRTGIGTIVDMDSLEVEVDVNEAHIGRVQPQMPVQAVLNAYPDWKIPARVIATIPTADRSKATVKVRIGLNMRDPRIVPDMGVKVSFLEAEADSRADAAPREGVWVPEAAISMRDGHEVVFRRTGEDRAQQVHIQRGEPLGAGQVHVRAGLAAGDVVVLNPPPELRDGQRIAPTH